MHQTEREFRDMTTAALEQERDSLRRTVHLKGWEWARFRLSDVNRVLADREVGIH